MKAWEIERMFKEDIREKKKAGSGAFHMRGKGVRHGFNGALRTPYHFMKTKEKNKLNGEVETYNMYTTLLDWTEFERKDKETQKMLLTKWREIYPNTKIMEELSVNRKSKLNSQSYADIVNELGCPKKARGGGTRNRVAKPKQNSFKFNLPADETEEVEEESAEIVKAQAPTSAPIPKEKPKQVLLTNGLHLEYNGTYDAEMLSKIFTKLQLIIDGEENKYNLSISLTEQV